MIWARSDTTRISAILLSFVFTLMNGTQVFAGDSDCCDPPQILQDRNCVVGTCSDVPSGCGCLRWECSDGSKFQVPPNGCVMVGNKKLCPLGSSVTCSKHCYQCGNQKCIDPPCTPLDTCQSSCGTGCPGGASTSSSSPKTGPDCRFTNPHGPCELGCDQYEDCSSTTCYWPETNLDDPGAPSELRLDVGAIRSSLTTNRNIRSLVPNPLAGESVTMAISRNTYSGADGVDYSIRANNMGVMSINPGWVNYTDNPLRSEDVRYRGGSHSGISFNPVLGARAVLYQNAIGELWGHKTTHDKCDSDTKTGPDRYGYYLVNTLPSVSSVQKSFGDPAVTSGTSGGCSSTQYTGFQANNPVGFTMTFNDRNNGEYRDVEALYVWFANRTTGSSNPPSIAEVQDSGAVGRSGNDSFGFMVRKEGATWITIPDAANRTGNVGGVWGSGSNIYVSTNGGGWNFVKTNDGIIKGSDNASMVRVFDVSVSEAGDNLRLEFKAQFYNGEESGTETAADGDYRIFGGISDHYSLLPLGGTSIRRQPVWHDRGQTWNIDLTRPEVVLETPYISAAQVMSYEVDATDTFSGVRRVLGAALRTSQNSIVTNGPIDSHQVTDYLGASVPMAPDPVQIDLLLLPYTASTPLWTYNQALNDRVITINIRDNEGGGFRYFATSFDNACNNSAADSESTTLFDDIGSPWLITKGGSAYSWGGANVKVKDFGNSPNPDRYDFQTVGNVRYGFYRSKTQLSSEFLGGNSDFIGEVIYREPENSTEFFQLLNYEEDNNKPSYWFEYLTDQYEWMKIHSEPGIYGEVSDQEFIDDRIDNISDLKISQLGTAGSFVVVTNKDLEIASGMICDDPTLFLVDADLTINPSIVIEDPASPGSSDLTDGCLFIVSGNIVITGGDRVSTSPPYPKYDLLEGLFLAENRIDIEASDLDESLPARDGLKVHGSLLAMGAVDSPAITMQRSLKLVDNTQFPAEAVHYDPRYLELIKFFFGGIHYTYKRETGWKPL